MRENRWIRDELDTNRFSCQQQEQSMKDKQQQQHQEDKDNRRETDETCNQPDRRHWLLSETNAQARTSPEIPNNNNPDSLNNNNNNDNANQDHLTEVHKKNKSSKTAYTKSDDDEPITSNTTTSTAHKRRPTNTIGDLPAKTKTKRQQQLQQAKKEENEVNLSFCGCGFLGIYHVGVASCFHEYAPQLSMHKIAGSSVGSLVAVAHICGNLQLAYATTDILKVAIDARARALGPFHPSFDITATMREALERALPEDVHLKASGKLHVSLTRVYDGENVIVSQFDSKEDVIQVLICSCFIPFWSGLVAPKYKGISYVDGGFSNNLLILDDKTVTVSPFAGEADICPQDDTLNLLQVSLSNTSFSITPNNLYRLSHALLPPSPEVLSDLCERGFADGIRFLQQMKLISCIKCLEIRSSLLVTTNGEDMEEAFTQQVHSSESMKSTSSFQENHHIRLEQQEQKMIEINVRQRRDSLVSTKSQTIYQQQLHHSASQQQYNPFNDPSLSGIDRYDDEDDEGEHDDEDLEEDYEEIEYNCDECVLMRQKASRDPLLPKQFSDRIRDACDTVNKSLSNWIYSHRPIKYLSYLAAPYYVPIDVSLALIYRCWRRLPFIKSELVDCVYQIVNFLIGIIKRMNSKSTSTMLMESSCDWEKEAAEYEKEMICAQQLKSKTKDSRKSVSRHHPQQQQQQQQPDNCNLTCIGNNNSSTDTGACNDVTPPILSKSTKHSSTTQLHSLEDTFDSIVDVTSNQEARIFAYYFRDAKNRLQVTEIFDLQRAAELSSSSTTAQQVADTQPSNQSHLQPSYRQHHYQQQQNHHHHHHQQSAHG